LAETVVLFGCGEVGRRTARCIKGRYNVIFTDNYCSSSCVDGIPVLSPSDAIRVYGGTCPFVVTIFNGSAVRQQLKDAFVERVVSFPRFYEENADLLMPWLCIDHQSVLDAGLEQQEQLYGLLADDESRQEFIDILSWHGSRAKHSLPARRDISEIYFPDFIKPLSDEVYVDCGAFDGDTIRRFMESRNGQFQRIFGLEPDFDTFEKLWTWRNDLPPEDAVRIQVMNHPAGCRNDDSVSVDSLGRTTYVKVDVEGAELDVIASAWGAMRIHQPVMAVVLYHRLDHLWKVPLAIHAANPDYKLFLRRFAEDCWESVVYAVPKDRIV